MAEPEKPNENTEHVYYGPSGLKDYPPDLRQEILQALFRTVEDPDLSPEAHEAPSGTW